MALQQLHGVQPNSSYSGSRTSSKQAFDFHQALNTISLKNYKNSLAKPLISKEEAKVIAAHKHSMAESKRRRRINGHYDSLRTILPKLVKMNKASVLEETVLRVKEMTKSISEWKAAYRGGRSECVFPGGSYKVRVRPGGYGLAKVTFSCEDKGKLMSDVAAAVRSVKGKVEKAEMVTMGGRTKCVLLVQGINGNEELDMLRRSVNEITKNREVQ